MKFYFVMFLSFILFVITVDIFIIGILGEMSRNQAETISHEERRNFDLKETVT